MTTPGIPNPPLKGLEEENKQLKRAVEELSILNDLARTIGATLSTQEIIQTIVRRSLRAVHAEQGVITLVDEEEQGTMRTLVRTMVSSSEHGQYHLDQALLGWMYLNRKPLAIQDPQNDNRFQGVVWDANIHSLLAVPMMVKSEVRGILTIYNKKEAGKFTDDDQRILSIIASQSAQIVENARLYEKEKALLQMQEEVRFASRIQMELLPKAMPDIPGYDIAGTTIPAQTVGGDYFDFIPVENHRLAVCLGDVTGKGLPASLLMANLQATLRGQAVLSASPKDCIARANRLLFRSTGPEKFATVFYGILDAQKHTLSFSNAGHDYPFVLSKTRGQVRLKDGGIPLAMMDEFPYEEGSVTLEPGETVVIYSDGITEAMNSYEVEFSEQRVEQVLQQHHTSSAQQIIERLIAAAKEHAGTHPQSDDMTVVVIKRVT